MKDIKLLHLDKYTDAGQYKFIEEGIYLDLNDGDDTNYRLAIVAELEDGEDTQYPIEDVLDMYSLYVSDFPETKDAVAGQMLLELAGELADLQKAKGIVGKRVYNKEVVKDGKTYLELVIE